MRTLELFDSSSPLSIEMNPEESFSFLPVEANRPLAFEGTGRLCPGIHDATFEALRALTCFNQQRKEMWTKLTAFLALPSLENSFSYAYFGGGFLSAKPKPKDIDLVLQTSYPYGPEAFNALSRLFVVGLRQIEAVYGIHLHFWMSEAPEGFCDFRTFFQYERVRRSEVKLDPTQGVVRLDLLSSEFRTGIRLSEGSNF